MSQEVFELSGHCIAECTGVGLPQSGIIVFGSQLHTHLTGTKVRTRHIRDGEELYPLNYDDHYSTHFQEIRLLPEPVKILPVIYLLLINTVDSNWRLIIIILLLICVGRFIDNNMHV